ncbi:AAA family ATPase [Pseudomonadota bacterium]
MGLFIHYHNYFQVVTSKGKIALNYLEKPTLNDQHDLELILRSHFPIIRIETHEEQRAIELLSKTAKTQKKQLQQWTITDGLNTLLYSSGSQNPSTENLSLVDHEAQQEKSDTDPVAALRKIRDQKLPGIYTFLDFHDHFDNPIITRLIKEIAQNYFVNEQLLVFISHDLTMPNELSKFIADFELNLPDKEQINTLLHAEAKAWALKSGKNVKADPKSMELLIGNLAGLTVTDTKRFLRNAIHNDGAITHADLPDIQKAKYDLLGQDGLVSFEYDTAHFSDVGGMKNLKAWLEKRHEHFINPSKENHIDTPKGILLVGVQGGGKSLAAKAVAGVWGTPLLRLDFGVLYNKFFGETEKNIRHALKLAETMSPCVLWIDEIEKGISTGGYDNGTSQRVLGTLLTWMAETSKQVFIVATANNIQTLPPELIRKGRLDEIFFVDLPSSKTRKEIFSIHLKKRGYSTAKFDLDKLMNASTHFSGAEIEQAIVGATYSAHADKTDINTLHVLEELLRTKPLSTVMSEKITELRHWAKERTVPAD